MSRESAAAILIGTALGSAAGLVGLLFLLPGPRPAPVAVPPPPRVTSQANAPRATASAPFPDLTPLLPAVWDAAGRGGSVHLRTSDGRGIGARERDAVPVRWLVAPFLAAALTSAWQEGRLDRTDADADRMRRMLRLRDGLAADELLEKLGFEELNQWLAGRGFPGTAIHRPLARAPAAGAGENLTTAADLTALLAQLADAPGGEEVRLLLAGPDGALEFRAAEGWCRRERLPDGRSYVLAGLRTATDAAPRRALEEQLRALVGAGSTTASPAPPGPSGPAPPGGRASE